MFEARLYRCRRPRVPQIVALEQASNGDIKTRCGEIQDSDEIYTSDYNGINILVCTNSGFPHFNRLQVHHTDIRFEKQNK